MKATHKVASMAVLVLAACTLISCSSSAAGGSSASSSPTSPSVSSSADTPTPSSSAAGSSGSVSSSDQAPSSDAAGSSGAPSSSIAPAPSTGKTIAMLPRATNIPYFDASASGGSDAAKELGYDFKVVGPTEVTASAQLPFIQTLTSQHVAAIVLSANDVNALLPALKKAADAGIKIVTFDSDTAPDGRSVFISPASADDIGKAMMQQLGTQMNYAGDYAVLSSSATSPNENAWMVGVNAEKADPKYAGMTLVKTVYGQDEQASFNATIGLLQAYPNLKGILGTNSFAISAAARAVQSKGLTGKVAVTGLGTPNDMRKYVKDGTAPSFVLWSPRDLGYCGVYAAADLIAGSISGKSGETFQCGSVGKLSIGDDGVTQLGKPTVFNKDNIDQFNF